MVDQVKQGGFTHAVLLGMGGSSLCVEVLEKTFGTLRRASPQMHVLDSTDPAQIRAIEKEIDIAKTLFIVSSKSGSTLEPNIFKQYFFERVAQTVGAGKAGKHFFAITDPGSKMEQVAKADSFRCVFHGLPSIGGRYSALSNFGMVPAAVMGIDFGKLLDKTEEMVHSCTSCVTTDHNPGVILGTILGTLAKEGRDKVTLVTSPAIADFGRLAGTTDGGIDRQGRAWADSGGSGAVGQMFRSMARTASSFTFAMRRSWMRIRMRR